jgi:hypothetical protein
MESNDLKTVTNEAGKMLKEEVLLQNLFRTAKENQDNFNQSCKVRTQTRRALHYPATNA